jgi:hypothetical protein
MVNDHWSSYCEVAHFFKGARGGLLTDAAAADRQIAQPPSENLGRRALSVIVARESRTPTRA